MAKSSGRQGAIRDFDSYQALVQTVYAAALDQERWDDCLAALSRAAGGVYTHILGHNIEDNVNFVAKKSLYPDEYLKTYADYYGALNPWAPGMARAPVGLPTAGDSFCSKEELFRTEFYNDWILPLDDISAGGGIVLFNDDVRFLILGGNIRRRDQEKLEGDWLSLLGLLRPHLRNAFEITRALEGASLQSIALEKAHRDLHASVLVIDDSGQVTFCNATGEKLLAEGRVVGRNLLGRVSLADAAANSALQRAIVSLGDPGSDPGAGLAGILHITDAEGRLTHVCRTSRFDPSDLSFSPFGQIAAFVVPSLLLTITAVRPDRNVGATLRRLYGLTESEADIALAIADGASLREIAQRREVSLHTVRNQLKTIQTKTEMRRQSDLVRLVERLSLIGG